MMILYEFTYTDDIGRSVTEREDGIQAFLDEESFLQGWAPGYDWYLFHVQEEAQCMRYYYRVEGEYLDT